MATLPGQALQVPAWTAMPAPVPEEHVASGQGPGGAATSVPGGTATSVSGDIAATPPARPGI